MGTIRRIAIDNKQLGADIQVLGDAGLNENMGLPEVIPGDGYRSEGPPPYIPSSY